VILQNAYVATVAHASFSDFLSGAALIALMLYIGLFELELQPQCIENSTAPKSIEIGAARDKHRDEVEDKDALTRTSTASWRTSVRAITFTAIISSTSVLCER
jgi:hypothetical protein